MKPNEKRQVVSFRVPPKVAKILKAEAKRRGVTICEYVRGLLERHLAGVKVDLLGRR